MAGPGHAVAAAREADPVDPAGGAAGLEHDLAERHLGAPGCGGRLVFKLFDVS